MSRVREVRTRVVRRPLHSTFATALRSTDVIESVLVEIEDDDGIVGTGEAPANWRVTGESLAGIEACVDGPLAAVLLASDGDAWHVGDAVRAAVVGNHGAKAAVDVALHDLAARRAGVPLATYLGASTLTSTTDVTLAAGSVEELVTAAGKRVAEGFGALKLKVGTDAIKDVARVIAVRTAVGPEVAIRLDANQGWSPEEAIRVIGDLEDAGTAVELVEQPVPARDIAGLAAVTAAVHTPVMADEAVFDAADLALVLERRAADLLNVKLAKCGGIGPAHDLLERARAAGLGTMLGSMMETGIGVAAAASVGAAFGTSLVDDLDAAWWLAGSAAPLRYDGPTLHLSPAPGLGPVDA